MEEKMTGIFPSSPLRSLRSARALTPRVFCTIVLTRLSRSPLQTGHNS